jgi:hypothetical protein
MLAVIGLIALLVALAVPAFAAKPSSPLGQANEPAAKPNSPPGQANKPDKASKAAITITGTIQESTGADGRAVFTLQDGGTTYTLDGGPSWFYGDDHPLKKYVGQTVTVAGEVADGSTEIEVETVEGTALREPGRPPWAGGWKVVGERHPGWSQDKADRFNVDCWPPGHCKADAQTED